MSFRSLRLAAVRSMTAAAATTGPANGPRPASSMPATVPAMRISNLKLGIIPVAARYTEPMSLIADIIAQDPVGMEQLRSVRTLDLPDWCIAAGFVRNRVWDHLHGIAP